MSKLLVRRLGILLGIAIIFGGFFVMNKMAASKKPPPTKPIFETQIEIDTLHARPSTILEVIDAQGNLVAFNKINIFSEVQGSMLPVDRPFKIGTYFAKGDLLVRINPDETQMNLLAQRSNLQAQIVQMLPDLKIDYAESFGQWENYANNFEPGEQVKPLPDPLSDRERYFVSARNIDNLYYSIKSAEARLDKYNIYAPFSGVLTRANVNVGAVVSPGQVLGELMNTSRYELETSIPLRHLRSIQIGSPVRVFSPDLQLDWQGKIQRISDQIDPTTQTVKIYTSVRGQNLKEGMNVSSEITGRPIENAIEIPLDLLVDQNAVYAVDDMKLRLIPVEIEVLRRNTAVVTGIAKGSVLLNQKVANAFEGMSITFKDASEDDSTARLNN